LLQVGVEDVVDTSPPGERSQNDLAEQAGVRRITLFVEKGIGVCSGVDPVEDVDRSTSGSPVKWGRGSHP